MSDFKRSINAKSPNRVDVEVGRQIKLRRQVLGMSQTALASAIGVTFQQVQKYEKGVNRIGASRLAKIAKCLDVPVSHFFVCNQRSETFNASVNKHDKNDLRSFIVSSQGIALNMAFAKIRNPVVKTRILALIRAISGTADRKLSS
jgi:transcriptional regulator with XRE-family HTH domain